MRIISFWTKSVVFWRIFGDLRDSVHVFGNGQGDFQAAATTSPVIFDVPLNIENFQLELKENTLIGTPFIMEATPNRIFSRSDNLVLEKNGTVRKHIDPVLVVSSPQEGGEFSQSRLSQPDTISLSLNLNDSEWIETIDTYLEKVTDVFVKIKQPGLPDQTVRASIATGYGTKFAIFKASFLFTQPGTVQIVGEIQFKPRQFLGFPLITPNLISSPVSANIALSSPRQYTVEIDRQFSPNAQVEAPINGRNCDISVVPEQPSFYRYIDIISSLDQQRKRIHTGTIGQPTPPTTSSSISIPPQSPPIGHSLTVIDEDFFGRETTRNFNFTLVDVTPPSISIFNPSEDQVFYPPNKTQDEMDISVEGRVDDQGQSGYKPGTLTYIFNGKSEKIDPDNLGNFKFVLKADISPQRVVINARDQSNRIDPKDGQPGNFREVAREFIVAREYKPKTIDELLNQRSYLADLIRFMTSHVLINQTDGTPVSSQELSQKFMPMDVTGRSNFFGVVSDPGSAVGDRVVNELLPVVSLIRNQPSLGLLLHFAFEREQGQNILGSGPKVSTAALSRPGLIGLPGTEKAGTLVLQENTDYAVSSSDSTAILKDLGKDNADFSVGFWIYLDSEGTGNWRSVFYKGHEIDPNPSVINSNRTFAIFLYPDSNALHYRIGTVNNWNEGGDSIQEISTNRWTHIAYVKRGRELELFINGKKDSSVLLSGNVVATSDDLYMGKTPYPYGNGFSGALDDVKIYNFALSTDDIQEIARYRSSPIQNDPSPFLAYFQSAYESLLVAHGTSYEELRVLPAKGTPERRAIAERLGLTAPNISGDDLDILFPPSQNSPLDGEITEPKLEEYLAKTFGLPTTSKLLISSVESSWGGTLLYARQNNLSRRWQAEDATTVGQQRPLLDPDLVDPSDINSTMTDTLNLLQVRSRELQDKWNTLRNPSIAVDAALLLVYSQEQINRLETIDGEGQAGKSIVDQLPPLGLTMPAFRRVRFYQQVQSKLSEREKDDLAHLLTQVWKSLVQYPEWQRQEQSLSLWPSSMSLGVFIPGNYKRDFLPWRGNITDRLKFEQLVTARLGAFEALGIANEQAILDAQRTALPLYRDKLLAIADLPSAIDVMDNLTERSLMDVASTGTLKRSLIEHAILMLQRLIDGIRLRRFEPGHPVAKWILKTDWPGANNTVEKDTDFQKFDEEWGWMGSYGTWRSAKMTYLYPENRLFPDLRDSSTTPYHISQKFKTVFLTALRLLVPLEPNAKWEWDYITDLPVGTNGDVLYEYEQNFFMLVAVGVMLERSRKYSQALDWYGRVFDTRAIPADRAKAGVLIEEKGKNKPPIIQYDERWTLDLDPHTNAKRLDEGVARFGNPYTRFILARIVTCLVGLADIEFARGTDESRAKAQDLYIEAKQILGFEELIDLPATDSKEAYLPNPVFESLRDHVSAALRKLRRGLTYIGTPVMGDLTRNSDGISLLSRPTPYRFRVLMERAKQLVAIAQNLESQYLSALVQRDGEQEKVNREKGGEAIADESVNLRKLQQTEASNGIKLSTAQKNRSQLLSDRYSAWIAGGPNQYEGKQIDAIKAARDWRQVANIADSVLAASQAVQSAASLTDVIFSGGARVAIAVASAAAAAGRGAAQGFAIGQETEATISGILASQERRKEEWELQRDLAKKDILIAAEQDKLAQDRKDIADKELKIATIQLDQARQMIAFLQTKFTSVEFYDWMSGVLAEVYAFLLRTATSVALQAEGQLAFERQQTPGGLIKQDYWNLSLQQGSTSPDRRGITGSAKLLQDITALDQYAFDSERRLLNLSQTFSLSRLGPLEFEEFRQTGILSFATTLRMFDEGFPGHYMRLIKRLRISVAALIPPNQGIRATLSTSGLSRVVTSDPSFPTLVVRQEPQSVALTTPTAATGVFELDMQSELLNPFEGMGVDTNWTFELPPAANPFDYDTIFDVLISIDYTALNSVELRDRVVKQLPKDLMGDRAFSVRRDLPDTWYDLANNPGTSANIALPLSRSNFPSHLQDVTIRQIAINVRRKDGKTCDFKVKPSVSLPGNTAPEASEAIAIQGIASSRQSGAATWGTLIQQASTIQPQAIVWNFALSDAGNQAESVMELLRSDEIDDILIVFTFAGRKPEWR
jgi:Tc toxin complex TcA C-terminal TcB-binding domain/Concanavalin A-like lectin/glucanases superfamily